MAHALLLAPLPPEALTGTVPDLEVRTPTDQAAALADAEGAVVCVASWQGDGLVVDADLAAALAPTCRLVQVPAAGLDGIDLDACRSHGIPVSSAVGLNDVAVAEWVVWAVLDGLRGLAHAHASLQAGQWEMFGRARHELAGRRVGVVGLGAVGRAVVPRLVPFGVGIAYWTRTRDEAYEQQHGITYRDLDDLLATSDVLVLTIASTPQTRGLLSSGRLAAMPQGAVVVNAARGDVWDEQAVADAVEAGGLLAAVTDVFSTEPPPPDHPLLDAERITATPHVAGPTAEVVGRITQRVLGNVAAALADEPLEGLLP